MELKDALKNLISLYKALVCYLDSNLELMRSGQLASFEEYSEHVSERSGKIAECQKRVQELAKAMGKGCLERDKGVLDLIHEAREWSGRLLTSSQSSEAFVKSYLQRIAQQLGELQKGQRYIRSLQYMFPDRPRFINSSR